MVQHVVDAYPFPLDPHISLFHLQLSIQAYVIKLTTCRQYRFRIRIVTKFPEECLRPWLQSGDPRQLEKPKSFQHIPSVIGCKLFEQAELLSHMLVNIDSGNGLTVLSSAVS